MNKIRKISILVVFVVIIIGLIGFASSKKGPLWGEITVTNAPDGTVVVITEDSTGAKEVVRRKNTISDSNVILTENAKENFLNYVSEALSSGYSLSEIYINDQSELVVIINDNLNEKDLMSIKALMDVFDDAYWEYKDDENMVKVTLNYKAGKEIFFIQKNTENK